MYSIKQLLRQEPSAVKAAIVAILAALIITGTITLSGEAVAAWGIALELALGLLYVRPRVTPEVSAQAREESAATETYRQITVNETYNPETGTWENQ